MGFVHSSVDFEDFDRSSWGFGGIFDLLIFTDIYGFTDISVGEFTGVKYQ